MLIRLWMGCLCGLCACQPAPTGEVLGTLERDRLTLTAEANEPIAEIMVREGDQVQVGQALLRQVSGAMQPRLQQAQARLLQAEQQLRELQQGPRVQELTQARAALRAADSALAQAKVDYERALSLLESRLQSQALLDQARVQRDAAQAGRDQAQASLQLLSEGTRVEQIAQAQAARDAVKASLDELQISATRYVITAPRAGRIEAIPYKQGERPQVGAPLLVLLADDRLYARVYVPEPLRTRYQSGTAVQLHVDGEPQAFSGRVRYISAQAAFTPYYALTQQDRSRLSYLAEMDVQDGKALPVGLPVQVTLSSAPHD